MRLPIDVEAVKGFMDPEEGRLLHDTAIIVSALGACVEIGTYCGKSSVFVGSACKENGSVLFTIDHHRGSEENQPGWEYHDTDLWDDKAGFMDSLPFLRDTLKRAGLERTVIPIVGHSVDVARYWTIPIAMLLIDGGHAMEHALNDYRSWTPHIVKGGVLAIHDVFPNPEDGGRPPYEIYKMALKSGLFEDLNVEKSLRLLRRL